MQCAMLGSIRLREVPYDTLVNYDHIATVRTKPYGATLKKNCTNTFFLSSFCMKEAIHGVLDVCLPFLILLPVPITDTTEKVCLD